MLKKKSTKQMPKILLQPEVKDGLQYEDNLGISHLTNIKQQTTHREKSIANIREEPTTQIFTEYFTKEVKVPQSTHHHMCTF